ncbi:DUF4249 family protein [Robertkochia sediminum]|uniref:DUF4249 family protein n=1 Tax=Robertkochia sediminum TaxID=2785326 RepID=UPI0019314CAD|nr:DUF4249 family protein [Robertkochia sediminum]MBL7473705.1 DUF4249 domain-containing protein [Robertkochia sediminum]
MKRFLYTTLSTLFLLFSSCEDVVDIPLEDPEPRLVVNALIRVNSQEPINTVTVGLLLSSNFFADNPPVNDASVTLEDLETGTQYALDLQPDNTGTYTADISTEVLTSGVMELQILYKGELYTATSEFVPSTPIIVLEQGDSSLFDEESIEIIIGYNDPADQVNYYLLDYDQGEFFTSEDTFYQGQFIEFSFFHGKASPGDVLEVSILGADQRFTNYMNQILELSGAQGFTPFQTPVSAARGNIIGPNDHNRNFALGYFAIAEAYSQTLLIE